MSLAIRPVRPEDLPAAAAPRRRTFPYETSTVAALRWRMERAPERARFRMFAADLDDVSVEVGGNVVGYSHAMPVWGSGRDDQGQAVVIVDPDHRRRGIGSRLARAAEDRLRSIGAAIVRAAGPADEADGFATRRGYARRSTTRLQAVELTELPVPLPPPEGVELRPASDDADDPGPVHALDEAVATDEPGDTPMDAMPYTTWVDLVWNEPRPDRGLSIVFLVDGRLAGLVALQADGRTRLKSEMTGTLREHRGRGLAKYAKTAALHRARGHGFRTAYTADDAADAPMLAIDSRLCYRHHTTEGLYAPEL
ncbi:GNAT superfamily N-acetyltransferase [Nocardiopsis mwathae]|uniref:GNAT superfamily N-acetyltransferase n=1 Tax=Nocardiopsis mwathae TaxID=1472723 RepID=A0A7W9YFA0_9ACTN|nr:GNAT family N-acetyltransferase [Nocardiopsis mwathae]MBB6171100.1 GNAT superfamily N-acetyltransferase [Nocardiopsis mwathae]